ncbi:uncharacterized protein LOC142225864 [Haematobia irritans]|uniref:uncharacterized protein LOC142225864 n=1 Tax=Haematobia irritans TaxID=7368 RepID=UPI003F4FF697
MLTTNVTMLTKLKMPRRGQAKMAATLPESEDDVPMLDEEREINSSIAPLADEHTISTTTDSAILADNVATGRLILASHPLLMNIPSVRLLILLFWPTMLQQQPIENR